MINCRVNETVNRLFRLGNLTNIKTTSQNIQDKKLKFINHRQTKQCGTELSILIPLHGFANISSSKGSNLIQQILPEELWAKSCLHANNKSVTRDTRMTTCKSYSINNAPFGLQNLYETRRGFAKQFKPLYNFQYRKKLCSFKQHLVKPLLASKNLNAKVQI